MRVALWLAGVNETPRAKKTTTVRRRKGHELRGRPGPKDQPETYRNAGTESGSDA